MIPIKRKGMAKEIQKCLGFLGETQCKKCKRKDKEAEVTLVAELIKLPHNDSKYCNYYLR